MSSKSKEFRKYIEDVLQQHGVSKFVWTLRGSGHQAVSFSTVAGNKATLICPSTTSDHRALLNAKTSAKRAIRQADNR